MSGVKIKIRVRDIIKIEVRVRARIRGSVRVVVKKDSEERQRLTKCVSC